MSMADPINALLSLQHALDTGIPLNLRELDEDYQTRYDEFPIGHRFIFAKIINGEVQTISIFGLDEPIDGIECYSVGYAVSENHRRRGLAVEAFNKGVEELKKMLKQTKMNNFYVEAVIDRANAPSIKLAEKLFLTSGMPVIERESNILALQFKKLIVLR